MGRRLQAGEHRRWPGPVYLATVEDLFSRRMLGFAQSDAYPTRATRHRGDQHGRRDAVRGGDVAGVIFHTDKGSQYTSDAFAEACRRLNITQSMGRVGCALDNAAGGTAAAESFFSTLEHELVTTPPLHLFRPETRPEFVTRHRRLDRHRGTTPSAYTSTNNPLSPTDYELANAV